MYLLIKWSYWSLQLWTNFSNCIEKPEKFRTSTGFEPMTSWFWCNALTNWAMKPKLWEPAISGFEMFLWWLNQWTKWFMKWIVYNSFHNQFIHCIPVELIFRRNQPLSIIILRIPQWGSTKLLACYLWNSFHCLCHGIVGPQSLLNKITRWIKIKEWTPLHSRLIGNKCVIQSPTKRFV